MHYYVFPDIHGRNDLLQMALTAVYEQNPQGGKIIFLGDYIDRGPDSLGVLRTVMNPPDGWEFVTLKGNHEDMFYGGYMRDNDYYDYNFVEQVRDSEEFDFPGLANWFEDLPIVYREGKNVFAHAYYDPLKSDEEQNPRESLWARFGDNEPYDGNGLFLTHGHTPRKHGPIFSPNRLNLDAGAVFYGRFVIAEFEEGKTGPTGFQEFEE